jgi:hypothetical protein
MPPTASVNSEMNGKSCRTCRDSQPRIRFAGDDSCAAYFLTCACGISLHQQPPRPPRRPRCAPEALPHTRRHEPIKPAAGPGPARRARGEVVQAICRRRRRAARALRGPSQLRPPRRRRRRPPAGPAAAVPRRSPPLVGLPAPQHPGPAGGRRGHPALALGARRRGANAACRGRRQPTGWPPLPPRLPPPSAHAHALALTLAFTSAS